MKHVKHFSLALAMLINFVAVGQLKTITGVVTDGKNSLPMANIKIKGTRVGTQTDLDGKFSLQVSEGATLVASFQGYTSNEVTIGKANHYVIVLKEEANVLKEVVVHGYRTVSKKQSVAASCRVVTSKIIENRPNANVMTTLQGQLAGVSIQSTDSNRDVKDKKGINSNPDESYGALIENVFESPVANPLSTFSIDVDNASYTNIRRLINNGQKVPKDAVRVEEMVNFFKYNYNQPTGVHPFSIHTEYSACPWNTNSKLLRIALQGKTIESQSLPASNLVFLVDVSGSMNDANKLPLVKQSLKALTSQLRADDKIAIVVYAGAAGLVLPPTSGKEKNKIIEALDQLSAGGSTAGGAGIELAYKVAQENFIKGGNNRVIIATDGDFNVGYNSTSDLGQLIEEKRKTGVFLTCLGYGMGNYKDTTLETLADKGNGNYAYIDTAQEANRFLVKEFKGSLFAIAKDVKIQIEFNPALVQAYRLIGYENRKLRPEDFKNDAIDAGELGSGHTVTAFYEIIPTGISSSFYTAADPLKYASKVEVDTQLHQELATIKFRYKKPEEEKSIEMTRVIQNNPGNLYNSSTDFRFATAVAWFGLYLRDSKLIQNNTVADILDLANNAIGTDKEGYRYEFIRLMESQQNN
ncbi:vWA domain-containing protein [Flavobacterium sp. N1719]|uniref:vWA domain-containing protein n=1 Tax=Flavobacterium sp. N1719 TaxID=2885633 RepID=UPI002222D913|nr:von Willebrand factor type A domain-containing protein [Flavobacterium sp. N1719]